MTTFRISVPGPHTAYDRLLLAYDPEDDSIYTWAGVGAGVPEHIYRGQHPALRVCLTVVESALEAWAREHAEEMRRIVRLSGTDEGAELLDALQDRVSMDIDQGELATRWDAGEFFAGDPAGVVDSALLAAARGETLEQAARAEVESAGADGHVLDQDDAERALRALLEDAFEELEDDDNEDEEERLRLVCRLLQRLYAETRDGVLCVVDPAGGVWWPFEEAQAEIDASDDPEATAIRICQTTPMRGTWHA